MIAAIVKRKHSIDIFLLDKNREIKEMFSVEDVELYKDMDDFERTIPEKEKSFPFEKIKG